MKKQTRQRMLLDRLGNADVSLSAQDLARELDVTSRTIERDLSELRAEGVAITGDRGRTGGVRIGTAITQCVPQASVSDRAFPSLRSDLIGRDRELSAITNAVHDARAGVNSTFVISGENGIGKTRLLSECVEIGARNSAAVIALWHGYEATDSDVWLRKIANDLAHLADGFSSNSRHSKTSNVKELLAVERRVNDGTLTSVVKMAIREIARTMPILFVIDDGDHLAGQMLPISHLNDGAVSCGIVMVTSARRTVGSSSSLLAERETGIRHMEPQHFELQGFSVEEVHEFLSGFRDQPIDEETTEKIHRITRGNPLFVQSLAACSVEDISELAENPGAVDIPLPVATVVGTRLAQLSHVSRQVLDCLAVFNETVTRQQLTAIGHALDDIEIESELAHLIDSDLIMSSEGESGSIRFRNEIVRTTLVSVLSHRQRTALHALAVEVLRKLQLLDPVYDLDLYARHAVLAVQQIGVDKTVQICIGAGSSAVERFDWESAREHFQAALGVCTDQVYADMGAPLLEGLGIALLNILDPFESEQAVEILETAFDLYITMEEPEHALRIASLPFSAIPRRTVAVNLIRRGLELCADNPVASSRLLARLSAFNAIAEGDIEAAERSATEAVSQAESSGDPRIIGLAHSHVAQVAAQSFRIKQAIKEAGMSLTDSGSGIESTTAFLANHSASIAHLFAGEIEDAIRRAEASIAVIDTFKDDHRRLGLMWLLIRLHMDSGDLQGAVNVSDEALQIYPDSPIHLGLRAWLEFELGNEASGRSFLEQQLAVEVIPDAPYGLAPVGIRTLMLSVIAGLTGDRHILQLANRAATGNVNRGFGSPFQRIDAFQVSARLVTLQNDRFTASQLLAEYNAVSSEFDVPGTFWHAAAQVNALAGDPEQALALYEAANEFLTSTGQWLSFVHHCYDYVRFLLVRSDPGSLARANELLELGIEHAVTLSLVPHVERLTLLKHRVAATEATEGIGIDSLSGREHEVLGLITAGLSNSEIAERLYLSEHTVHRHVSAILGKLGVRGRTQAALIEQTHSHG